MEKVINNLVGKITEQAITIHDLRQELKCCKNDEVVKYNNLLSESIAIQCESKSLKMEIKKKNTRIDFLLNDGRYD